MSDRISVLMDWENCQSKMFILPKEIYKLNETPVNIAMAFFTEIEQTILTFVWNHKVLKLPKRS